MPGLGVSRFLVAALVVATAFAPFLSGEEDGSATHITSTTPPYIFISFVGGFVHKDNSHHGPVILAHRMQQSSPKGTHIEVFENRHRRNAYETILHLLDSNHDGVLSEEEKTQARIVLVGQSWGASAVVLLARELDRVGIPVLLTVQVDSVAKPWQHDGVIPENVTAAVNFYQPHGFVHGRPLIQAADNSKTQIIGNFRYDYNQIPVACDGMPWFERAFIPGHMHTECDTNLWGRVETLVRQHLEVQPSAVSATLQ